MPVPGSASDIASNTNGGGCWVYDVFGDARAYGNVDAYPLAG